MQPQPDSERLSIQVHFFADLKDKQDVPAFVDGCYFHMKNGTEKRLSPGTAVPMFDNHVYYTGYRVICQSPFSGTEALDEAQTVLAGLTWQGRPYEAQIPVTQVCAGVMFISCSNSQCSCLDQLL